MLVRNSLPHAVLARVGRGTPGKKPFKRRYRRGHHRSLIPVAHDPHSAPEEVERPVHTSTTRADDPRSGPSGESMGPPRGTWQRAARTCLRLNLFHAPQSHPTRNRSRRRRPIRAGGIVAQEIGARPGAKAPHGKARESKRSTWGPRTPVLMHRHRAPQAHGELRGRPRRRTGRTLGFRQKTTRCVSVGGRRFNALGSFVPGRLRGLARTESVRAADPCGAETTPPYGARSRANP